MTNDECRMSKSWRGVRVNAHIPNILKKFEVFSLDFRFVSFEICGLISTLFDVNAGFRIRILSCGFWFWCWVLVLVCWLLYLLYPARMGGCCQGELGTYAAEVTLVYCGLWVVCCVVLGFGF